MPRLFAPRVMGHRLQQGPLRNVAAIAEAQQGVGEAEVALQESKEAFKKKAAAASKDVGATCKRVDHAGIKNVPHARLVASEHGWVRRMVIEQDGIFFDFDYTSLIILTYSC